MGDSTQSEEKYEQTEKNPADQIIADSIAYADLKINDPRYRSIMCSISGGADSDVMMDICIRCDRERKIRYVYVDPGLEYTATKIHIAELEKKYGVLIEKKLARNSIPEVVREYGQPFLSKRVSDYIGRLQLHNFAWEDRPYEELREKYCIFSKKRGKWIGCDAVLQWWCNRYSYKRLNIDWNKGLKLFLIENPPQFKISAACCKKSKKEPLTRALKEADCDLNIFGVRKAEGGIRAFAYTGCFSSSSSGADTYRPLFFYRNDTRDCYCERYRIRHSKCYEEYGLKRTGCVGCPFGRNLEDELKVLEVYEPDLYHKVNAVFAESYAYTRAYRKYAVNL